MHETECLNHGHLKSSVPCPVFFFFGAPFCSPLLGLAPCGFTTEYFSNLIQTVLYCTTSIPRHGFTHAECCCRCCVATLLLMLLLLLFVIVCPMTKIVAGSNLIPVFSFSSFNHDVFLMYPLAVLSHLRARFACTTSPVITSTRRG